MSSRKSDKSLKDLALDQGIDYLLPILPTLHGDNKGSFIPTTAADMLEKEGAGIFAFGSYMLKTNIEKQYGRPDNKTLTKLPWKPKFALVLCNMYQDGKPFAQCPRSKLIEMQEKAKLMGFYLKTGFEAEFQLLEKDEHKLTEDMSAMASYQSPHLTMARADILKDVLDTLTNLGWKPYQAEHEAAPAQFEVNYDFADALTAADRQSVFKFLVKEIARNHGCRATFMPLPFQNAIAGNGLHLNLSIWDPVKEVNLMPADDENAAGAGNESGLSAKAEHFLAGILEHAEALCAVLCPNINSYKRLHHTLWVQMSGPLRISWGRNTRHPMIRLPNNERIEVRCADASASPYLALAAVLAAGMDGIERELPLSKSLQLESDQFLDKQDVSHLKTLPKTLMEACEFFAKDEAMRKYLGEEIVEGFVGCKKMHWEQYLTEISKFEIGMADDY